MYMHETYTHSRVAYSRRSWIVERGGHNFYGGERVQFYIFLPRSTIWTPGTGFKYIDTHDKVLFSLIFYYRL